MDTNKMRDAFEVALAKQAAEDGFAKPSLRRNKNNGDYVDPFEQAAWWAWQASREAVVVELPKFEDYPASMERDMRESLRSAIEAQGLKVTP
ncbi:hypothetical protein JRG49_06430 [Pseudomonas fulva]|uniref:hypothetical protein n=1 Tax=Pseudomonas TaxID=286 RepID=UPI0019D2AE39|nr:MULTISPECIES: hypothetical protein [Pseudomonas]MCY4125909.1 hypothetical protein [Pseudomonas sp.]MBN6789876.1 hypothetical protein [Pseudomonas fulva]MBN6794846.1 hypothetical protein [Pseudomonas fulva]MBN6855335.1 hypothetical protein [Pseudomonas fulva]MBN6872468.1 hypothetical protein [Pseudomonas fulva]